MNPLTQIKNTQKISRQEIANGVTESQSWHARFKHSAYVYTGGLPFNLTDGDLLAVFSQYGEVIDVNLIRHADTGKSRGFGYLAYEDQRSTNLAVDNLNGTKIGGRIVTVDHVDNYRRKIAEIEGREMSESGDEAEPDNDAREAEAMNEAMIDGAQIVSTEDAAPQAGIGGEDNADAPWASKSSVYALLNSDLPTKPKRSAEEEEEDPLAAMKAHKKHKKEDKKKRKKDDKEKERKRDKQEKRRDDRH